MNNLKGRKKAFSIAAIIIAIMVVLPLNANAAGKIKLSATKKTMNVGEKTTLKVKGTKKKVKWSSNNKKVATVTNKGKVTAKKSGKATITAKVGKKSLKCKLTVKKKPKRNTIKEVEYELQDTGKGVVVILKNNNSCHVYVTASIIFYRNGKAVGTSMDYNDAFEKGQTCALFLLGPIGSDYEFLDYDDFKISIQTKAADEDLICVSSKINIISDFGIDNVCVTAKNNSGKSLSLVDIVCVFYDSNGNAVGYDNYPSSSCENIGGEDFLSFDFPIDKNYNTIKPNSYKIYVNRAYTYTWIK